jgi:hypothetical protein
MAIDRAEVVVALFVELLSDVVVLLRGRVPWPEVGQSSDQRVLEGVVPGTAVSVGTEEWELVSAKVVGP